MSHAGTGLPALAGPAVSQDAPQRKGRPGAGHAVPRAQLTSHWLADDARFWYRVELKGGA